MAKKIALVTAFPPGKQSLNEYGYHLALAFASLPDVSEVVVVADRLEKPAPELALGPKIRVKRVWSFNKLSSIPAIIRTIRAEKPAGAVFNLQTATFGDSELVAAAGLATPLLTRLLAAPSGVIMHNIIEGIDLEGTILKGKKLRQAGVKFGGWLVSQALSRANWFSTTLDTYAAVYRNRFPHADISMVPHGSFETKRTDITRLATRPNRICTMGKFGTYKRLETVIAAFEIYCRHPGNENAQLIIGGTDHPNAPGYMRHVESQVIQNRNIHFAGYIPEETIPAFFMSSRFAVFDYLNTTGSSGVLHQCASFGTFPVFPRIGDFVELCNREGLLGQNYASYDADDMANALLFANQHLNGSQAIADNNLEAVSGFTIQDVARFHLDKVTSLRAVEAGRTRQAKSRSSDFQTSMRR